MPLNINEFANDAAALTARDSDALVKPVCEAGAAYLDTMAELWTFLDQHPAMRIMLEESNEWDGIWLQLKAHLAK